MQQFELEEIGQNAALVSNLRSNTSDPQSVGGASNGDAQQESECGASSDLNNAPDDLEASIE